MIKYQLHDMHYITPETMSTEKKPLSEQAKEDKSWTIYGSALRNDEVTRNASNGKGHQRSEKERKRDRDS